MQARPYSRSCEVGLLRPLPKPEHLSFRSSYASRIARSFDRQHPLSPISHCAGRPLKRRRQEITDVESVTAHYFNPSLPYQRIRPLTPRNL